MRFGLWLLFSFGLFGGSITIANIILTIFNPGYVNHIILPIFQYAGIIKILWQDSIYATLAFIATKSLFAFTYQDPVSKLNLWSYEFDLITTLVYLLSSMYGAKLLLHANHQSKNIILLPKISGIFCLVLSVSYITVISHCAGPTWIGFVTAYGLGATNFEHRIIWQILLVIIGVSLILVPANKFSLRL